MASSSDITALLIEMREGAPDADERLYAHVYDALKEIAHRQLRKVRSGQTLNTTALVHEAYLKLVDQTKAEWKDRVHFFSVAALAMRQILLNYARKKAAQKRGGGWQRIDFDEANLAPEGRAEVLLALDERLTWAVVEQILTAREQDRQDIVTAEENGGEFPIEDDPLPTEEGEPEEEEDQASFRAADIANFQAFVARVAGEAQEGEEPAVEGLDAEIYAGFRPWLVVRSSVFVVEVAATSGKVTRTIRAVYRRTGRNAAGQPPAGQPNAATDPNAAEDDGLPKEPDILLTLLFKDVSMD